MMTTNLQFFSIPGTLPGLNEMLAAAKQRYRGKSLGYARLKREVEARVGWAIRAAQLRPIRTGTVLLHIRWTEPNRKRDPDNIVAARKFILDALVSQGVLTNDGWAQVRGFRDTLAVEKGKGKVEVWLEE